MKKIESDFDQDLRKRFSELPLLTPRDGFASRVMQNLPKKVSRRIWSKRVSVKPGLFFAAAIGCLILIAVAFTGDFSSLEKTDLGFENLIESMEAPIWFVCLSSAIFVLTLIDRFFIVSKS